MTAEIINTQVFFKKNDFSWFRTREDLSIDVSFTNVGLILTKLEWFLFSGYGQTNGRIDERTDRRAERQTVVQTRFWNPHMETYRPTKNFNSKLKIRSYLSIAIYA